MSESAKGSHSAPVVMGVTPEMIQAGLLEFADRDRWGESDDETVVRIYRAMEEVRRRGSMASASRGAKPAGG